MVVSVEVVIVALVVVVAHAPVALDGWGARLVAAVAAGEELVVLDELVVLSYDNNTCSSGYLVMKQHKETMVGGPDEITFCQLNSIETI